MILHTMKVWVDYSFPKLKFSIIYPIEVIFLPLVDERSIHVPGLR